MIGLWLTIAAHAQSSGSFLSPGPLAQAHATIDTATGCLSCHAPLQGVEPVRCMACHERVEQQVRTQSGYHANKGTSCQRCHSDHRGRDWDLIRLEANNFDHSETGFALEGRHAKLVCEDCHTSKTDWASVSPECTSCHRDVHGAARSKRPLLNDCKACHEMGGWRTEAIPRSVFDHQNPKHADYALEGEHTEADCEACHFDFRFLPTEHGRCATCHDDPHRADLGEKCESCHPTPTGWKVPGFDHRRTPFVLEGQHLNVDCYGCHKSKNATLPLTFGTCASCHRDVHGGQFKPQRCEDCHTVQTADFALRSFDHTTTDFPLRGKHVENTCEDCHGDREGAVYRPLAHADCDACHQDTHAGHFEPTPCLVCHAETSWKVAEFDHARTRFPLTGQHVGVVCETCHVDGVYAGLQHDSCADCHRETPHTAALAVPCAGCHVTSSFAEVAFDHVKQARFDLAPSHTKVACKDCHEATGDFKGNPTTCDGCHQDDRPWGHYEGTCDGCHQGAGWLPAGLGDLDHAATGFPLRGQHALTPCEACHPAGQARGSTPDTCGDCHRQDDPHRNLLGPQCEDCHTESSWFKTRFRHVQTGWPLVGLHRVAECNDCHAASFVGTPTDCWRCHESEAPTDLAPHQSVFFARCDSCHSPYGWLQVRYAH